jgi:hypothetical protein
MCPGGSPCAERFSDSPSGAMTTFHDRADSLDGVDQRKVLGNENQLYLVRIDRITLATRMVKCHVVQQQDGARRQRKVFNDSTKRMLIYKPPLRSKLRSPNEYTPDRRDGVIVRFEFDRT